MNRDEALHFLKNKLPFSTIYCDANQLIITQGDEKKLIYLIEEGWIKLSRLSEEGREAIIDICGPGEFIGLPILFTNNEFPVNVISLTPGQILSLDKAALERFLLQHPEIMAIFMIDLGQIILKIRGTKIAANQQEAIYQVRHLLVHFARLFGKKTAAGCLIPFCLTQQDIADFIGLSRPRVNICLKNLLERGQILRQGKFYVVPYTTINLESAIPHRTEVLQAHY